MKENMEADPIILHNWKYGHSKLNLNDITFPFYKTKDHFFKKPHHTEQKKITSSSYLRPKMFVYFLHHNFQQFPRKWTLEKTVKLWVLCI